MKSRLIMIITVAAVTFFTVAVHAGATMKMGSMVIEPFDPKKKKAGEECKASDECQKHHECKKDGDKSVCTAPPAPKLPPGVVT